MGVPLHVAKVMTYPERVSASNRQRLQGLILNGPNKHPGANIIRPGGDNEGFTKSLHYADDKQRKKMAQGREERRNSVLCVCGTYDGAVYPIREALGCG